VLLSTLPRPPLSSLFPYSTLFRSYLYSLVGMLADAASGGIGSSDGMGGDRATTHLYFETAAVITTFLLIGRWMEARAKKRGKSADRKSTRLNSSHVKISYAVFCLK